MHELRSYVDPEIAYDSNAYTITSAYEPCGLLTIYATHPSPSKEPRISTEYHMTLLRSLGMLDPDSFRQGAGALKNARDWAKEKREELIAGANGNVLNAEYLGSSTQSFVSSPSNEHDHVGSETSTDELMLDLGTIKISVGVQTSLPKFSSNRRSKGKPLPVEKGSSTG